MKNSGSHSLADEGDSVVDEEQPALGPSSDAVLREQSKRGQGCCGILLMVISVFMIVITFPIAICLSLKIVQEYERAIIFRLGRALRVPRGPGLFFVIPCTDQFVRVDLRTVSFGVPPQEILTKDSVTVAVDAVVYYRISNPRISVVNVENAARSTQLLAQTTLRNILGTKTLSEILTDRESVSAMMQHVLDDGTDPWGVQVERVEIKDVRLPVHLQRAMATEAEAQREARAQIIAAEGEKKASHALKEAADIINQSANALQLRYLQTLSQISAEKNSTIIFPLPVDLLSTVGSSSSSNQMTSEMTMCKSRDSDADMHHHTTNASAPNAMTSLSSGRGQDVDDDDDDEEDDDVQQSTISGEFVEVTNILPPPPYC